MVHEIAYMGLVVLVKKMSVLINFLMQNTSFVSALSNIYPNWANFVGHVWQDWHISRTLFKSIKYFKSLVFNTLINGFNLVLKTPWGLINLAVGFLL